jgi:hypothetical protein
MALHIDLYHEIRAQQLARKRDPLKIAMLVAIVMAIGLIAWYGFRLQQVSRVRSRAGRIENDWKQISDQQEKAKAREAELSSLIKTVDTLTQRIEGRFYWAPVIGQFLQTVPREVQIVKFEGDSTSDQGRRCTVLLHGISAGDQPRTVAEGLRTTLANNYAKQFPKATASFKALEDSADPVTIAGVKRAAASFTISLDLPLVDPAKIQPGAATAATPTLPMKRK